MNPSTLKEELRRDEGVRLKPYKDTVGKVTIGVARNLDDVGISMQECDVLLDNDIARVCSSLDAALPWWRGLGETRQRVVANMCFNLGLSRFMGFRKMLAALQSNKYDEAAREMLDSKWAQQVGDRAKRLANMMRGGGA